MKDKTLHVWYDQEGDFLEFRVGEPVQGYFQPLGDECFERVDEETGEIVGFAIFNFIKRFPEEHTDLKFPVEMLLKKA